MSKASRKNIVPGTVVVILAGPYSGTRAIAVKKLSNAKMVVVGPHSTNRFPIDSIPVSRLIATSTKVDISNIDFSSISEESFLKRNKSKINESDAVKSLCAEIVKCVEKDATLKAYLKSKFDLNRCFRIPPHQLKF